MAFGDISLRCAGIAPHAPWVVNWMSAEPRQSSPAVVEKAKIGMIGRVSAAPRMIVALRPQRSESDPRTMQPTIAPML